MDIKVDCSKAFVDTSLLKERAEECMEILWKGEYPYTGWVSYPLGITDKESELSLLVERIKSVASVIQNKCRLFIVIGIGGSYLGARAAYEALGKREGYPELLFAGNNLSTTYHKEILSQLHEKDTCICVISKSGTTTESSIAFSILKEALIEKYGENEAYKRIFAITDEEEGILLGECKLKGYTRFSIPKDIGGRYSVLTPVGLLPLAVSGFHIEELLLGAYECAISPLWDSNLTDYAITRKLLWDKGKKIEIFESYEPSFMYISEWLKQLFGESEGKEGKGLFPASLSFTADLHSMGQYLQEGNQIFFETIMDLKSAKDDIWVNEEGSPFHGKTMNEVNRAAVSGVMNAHEKVGVPQVKIDIPFMEERILGQLFYFFMMTCGISGLMLSVNPFDQPGVEAYKEEMRKNLKG